MCGDHQELLSEPGLYAPERTLSNPHIEAGEDVDTTSPFPSQGLPGRCRGQFNDEGGPLTFPTQDRDVTAMFLDDAIADG
jgi:hypothetical protein